MNGFLHESMSETSGICLDVLLTNQIANVYEFSPKIMRIDRFEPPSSMNFCYGRANMTFLPICRYADGNFCENY